MILTLAFRKEGRLWTGRCQELGTATDGRSLDQVHNELIEAPEGPVPVELHLAELADVGERERFFDEHGITVYPSHLSLKEVTRTLPVDGEIFFHWHRTFRSHRFAVGADR